MLKRVSKQELVIRACYEDRAQVRGMFQKYRKSKLNVFLTIAYLHFAHACGGVAASMLHPTQHLHVNNTSMFTTNPLAWAIWRWSTA